MDDSTTNQTNTLPANTAAVAPTPAEPQICTVPAKCQSNETQPAASQPSGTPPPASGSRPAEKHPRPAASGTSGTVFTNPSFSVATDTGEDIGNLAAVDGPDGHGVCKRVVAAESLPDVPDGDSVCRTGLPCVPDGCRTDAGPAAVATADGDNGGAVAVHVRRVDPDRHDLPADVLVGEAGGPNPDAGKGGANGAEKAGSTSDQAHADPHALVVHAPDKHADDDEPDVDDGNGKCPLPVEGIIRMGCMRAPRDTFEVFTNPDLADLLDLPILAPNTVIEAVGETTVSIVDADTHTWSEPPSPKVLESYIATMQPRADAAWISHGAGIKLIYIGPYHRDRALAAAFALPPSFNIELLNHTRHPRSTSTAHPGRKCGKVHFHRNKVRKQFLFHSVGRLTVELRQQALRQLDMQDGQ